ncbi:hypothetical protein PC9H_003234 [Pleurotus ostreatus]|uniref:Uncharacterized protein n=1 Tax=Pleurotus ostreatus TaxID=5322 RepID=A0A8H7DXT3_PLEOS|nr:uncharacterized protein PC9H_003234 [Pleurotus ostreatus]KAF7436401.1 hypothetical protein PC9H_003234 [Pleurotus ostreatus]
MSVQWLRSASSTVSRLLFRRQTAHLFAFLTAIPSGISTSPPIPCLSNSSLLTLEDVVTCFDKFTVSFEFYNQSSYDTAQPTPFELTAWTDTIAALLDVDGNCTSVSVPSVLQDVYSVTLYEETASDSTQSFCILSETNFDPASGFYIRGWGLFAVPASRPQPARSLHFSAPHPVFDMNTPMQASALFKRTGAKSLLIAGRIRTAFREPTLCIQTDPEGGPYFKTDPAHDTNEPFFGAAKTVHVWQEDHGGCQAASCAFVQMHGKAASTCSEDTAFMSTGLGRSESSLAWYTSPADAPIKRLQREALQVFTTWNISLPSDSSCGLTATTNVFGRLLNGIAEEDVCVRDADATTVSGQFIHIEQSIMARSSEFYDAWAEAFNRAFMQ